MGANAAQWKGQDRTQDRTQISCISEGLGGGGGFTPRNKFPIPEQTLYGCKCATVGTQHYTNVRQILGGGGGWATTNIEQDNESVLVSL